MILKAIVDDREYSLNVPEAVMAKGEDFFARLDADMDKGWQMSREWVQFPNRVERCQIVADKLLTALEKENDKLGMLMAGYILSRMPDIDTIQIDITGEIQNTQLIGKGQTSPAPTDAATPPPAAAATEPGNLEAMEQASNDVTEVFKVGKAYRFSVFDQDAGVWRDSPMIANEQDAWHLRGEALKERIESLKRGG
jgi:hypothetical protein